VNAIASIAKTTGVNLGAGRQAVVATSNIGNLNAALADYHRLSGLTVRDVLAKQGGKLSRAVALSLRRVSAPKGALREEALARLKAGRGIRIRESVRQRVEAKWGATFARKRAAHERKYWGEDLSEGRSKQQELVRAELAVRESSRGFLAISSRYPMTIQQGLKAISRYGPELSRAGIMANDSGGVLSFTWGGLSTHAQKAEKGLGDPVPGRAVQLAIQSVTEDIRTYTARKQQELHDKVARVLTRAK
jgi:hypothetical protein